eukprot:1507989-Rhodomonas_salina.1
MGSERGGDGGGVIDLMSGIDLMGSGGGGGGGGVIDLMGGGDDGAPHLPPLSHLDISPESSLPGVEDALAPRRISEVEVGGVGGDKGNGVSEGQTQDMIDRFELQSDDGRWSARWRRSATQWCLPPVPASILATMSIGIGSASID